MPKASNIKNKRNLSKIIIKKAADTEFINHIVDKLFANDMKVKKKGKQ